MNVIPAILPHSFEEIAEKLTRIEGSAGEVQIDLCDGVFGRERTWLPTGGETLPAGFRYQFDIMLNEWKLVVMYVLAIGASSIVMHVDQFTDEDIATLAQLLKPRMTKLGIAVSNDKEVSFHADMIRKVREQYPVSFIQVMGIETVGEQGQIFDESAVERVSALNKEFGDLPVQVDGGMNAETAKKVLGAGAKTAIVGSYIFGSEDPLGAISHLDSITADSSY